MEEKNYIDIEIYYRYSNNKSNRPFRGIGRNNSPLSLPWNVQKANNPRPLVSHLSLFSTLTTQRYFLPLPLFCIDFYRTRYLSDKAEKPYQGYKTVDIYRDGRSVVRNVDRRTKCGSFTSCSSIRRGNNLSATISPTFPSAPPLLPISSRRAIARGEGSAVPLIISVKRDPFTGRVRTTATNPDETIYKNAIRRSREAEEDSLCSSREN